MTLEQYIKENVTRGCYHFEFRADMSDDGEVSISVSRVEKKPSTVIDIDRNIPLDFVVNGNDLEEC